MQNWIKGRVQWFDKTSGEGMILDDKEGKSYYVHYSAIVSKQKRKNLDQGKEVRFQLYENLYTKQVDRVQQV